MKTLVLSMYQKVSHSPLATRLVVGAAWSVLGALGARLATVLSTIIIVRLLGKEPFGLFAIIQSTLAMGSLFAGMAMGVTATKYIAQLRSSDPRRLGRILVLINRTSLFGSVFITIILVACSEFIAEKIINSPAASGLIAIASIAVFFNVRDGYQNGAMLGFEAVRESTLGTLIATLVSIPFSIVFTMYYGLAGAVWGLVLASILKCFVSYMMLKKHIKTMNNPDSKSNWMSEWRELRDFAFPALLAGIMVTPAHWICHAMLVNTPNGHAEMALIGISAQWFLAVTFLPAAAGRIVLPVLTDIVSGNNMSKQTKVIKAGVLANIIIALPITVIISVMSPWIMSWYGSDFVDGWLVLTLAVCSAAIPAIISPIGQLLAAKGKMWVSWLMNLGWGLIYIGLSYSFLDYGALGIVVGLIFAYIVHSIWVTTWALKRL